MKFCGGCESFYLVNVGSFMEGYKKYDETHPYVTVSGFLIRKISSGKAKLNQAVEEIKICKGCIEDYLKGNI